MRVLTLLRALVGALWLLALWGPALSTSTEAAAAAATAECEGGVGVASCSAPLQPWRAASDHLERDVTALNLTDSQRAAVLNAYASLPHGNAELLAKAAATHVSVTPHLAYRYLTSAEWGASYHGRRFNESIADTIKWRHAYGIADLDTASIATLVQQRLAYTQSALDVRGRAVVYVRCGHDGPRLSPNPNYPYIIPIPNPNVNPNPP